MTEGLVKTGFYAAQMQAVGMPESSTLSVCLRSEAGTSKWFGLDRECQLEVAAAIARMESRQREGALR